MGHFLNLKSTNTTFAKASRRKKKNILSLIPRFENKVKSFSFVQREDEIDCVGLRFWVFVRRCYAEESGIGWKQSETIHGRQIAEVNRSERKEFGGIKEGG